VSDCHFTDESIPQASPNWLRVLTARNRLAHVMDFSRNWVWRYGSRAALSEAMEGRSADGLVFDANHNGVNEHSLRWSFEVACTKAGIVYGETKAGGIIWHDLRRTFATRLRANGVHEYDIQDLLGHAKPGVTKVYARATLAVLEDAVAKLTQPWGEVLRFERKAS